MNPVAAGAGEMRSNHYFGENFREEPIGSRPGIAWCRVDLMRPQSRLPGYPPTRVGELMAKVSLTRGEEGVWETAFIPIDEDGEQLVWCTGMTAVEQERMNRAVEADGLTIQAFFVRLIVDCL